MTRQPETIPHAIRMAANVAAILRQRFVQTKQ